VQRAIHQGLEGLCPEAVARIEQVHPTTIQRWIERAGAQAKAADKELITGVSTENVELDELHSFAGTKHPAEQEDELDQVGLHWTHCAMARDSRLLLEVVVGPRTAESALDLVAGAAKRLTSGWWPLWSGDGWAPYLFALTVVFGVLIHFIRTKRPGRPKEPEVVPDPRLRYGQVVKERKGRHLVAVTRRVIFGVEELIPLTQISTSLLERLNGTIRQHVVPLHRKTRSFAKCRTALIRRRNCSKATITCAGNTARWRAKHQHKLRTW
jgi:hypothetical protein